MRRPSSSAARDPDAKMQLLLRQAARVFAEKGFEGASMRDINRASRVSLAGLYYYFESKQKILYQIQIHAFSDLLQQLEARLERTADPVERLRELVRNHIGYFLSHPWETKVLAHEEEALEEPFRREVADIKRRYYQVSQGIFQGLPGNARGDHVKERVSILSLFGMMNWVYKWYNPKVDPPADRLADLVSAIFLRGIAVRERKRRNPLSLGAGDEVATLARATE
jgi:TetR/AcrR family transcriptional regulator, cholesterol catabolism regulator